MTTKGGHVRILPAQDVFKTLREVPQVTTTILDPWYNRGVGGEREGYQDWLVKLLEHTAKKSIHIFLWGYPEIVSQVLPRIASSLDFVAWLTWYYQNCPSVIRGWRSAQLTCLHFSRPGAKLHPEHFLNEAQLDKQRSGKLRYMPGPPSVIEVPLNIGFVGKSEQCGHPAQKPVKVFEPLLLMTTVKDDLVLDPMCGSGTTGVVCMKLGRRAILCDEDPEYLRMTKKRLEQMTTQTNRYF